MCGGLCSNAGVVLGELCGGDLSKSSWREFPLGTLAVGGAGDATEKPWAFEQGYEQ